MDTIDTYKAFSSERFTALLKADFTANKSNYIKMAIGAIGVFTAIALLISIFTVIDINSLKHASDLTGRVLDVAIQSRQNTGGMTYFSLSLWVLSIGLTVLGSLTFSNLSSKRSRISAFMVPASRIEKFTMRLLTYLVGGTLLLVIGFFIGMLICQIAFGGAGVAMDELSSFFSQDYSCSITVAFILIALLGNSLYALGSSLWPKLSWIKTWVVIMVVQWAGALLLMMVSAAHISWYAFFHFFEINIDLFKWGGLTLLALLNIACWVIAWWRYKNTQIIQRFMTK